MQKKGPDELLAGMVIKEVVVKRVDDGKGE